MKKNRLLTLLLVVFLVAGILYLLYRVHPVSSHPTDTAEKTELQTESMEDNVVTSGKQMEVPQNQVGNKVGSSQDRPTEDRKLSFQDLVPESDGEIIKHTYYTLSYSEEHEQAEWVYYELNPAMVGGTATRSDKFREDPSVTTGSAALADYKSSGYDRGHLCPAASMSISQTAMDESFYLSNMSPQVPSFNRGGWKKLEEQVREWAKSEKQLFVISGPVLKAGLPTIGANEVSIPEQYYKVIYAPLANRMIAFLMPNATISRPIPSYAVPVDSIEALTGIDFFSALSDSLENRMESTSELSSWAF